MAPKESSTKTDAIAVGTTFTTAFPHYLRIDTTFHTDTRDEDPHVFTKWFYEKLKPLCAYISTIDSLDAPVLWPTLFAVSAADGKTSSEAGQIRGCYLVGLKESEGAEEEWMAELRNELAEWERGVMKDNFFTDYSDPVPLLSTHLIKQSDLGILRVDEWMYPAALSNTPLLFTPDEPSGVESYEFLAYTLLIATPSTTDTNIRSKSPSGHKLNPAPVILNRLRWDASFDIEDFIVVYEDRHDGLMEMEAKRWPTESTEDDFIPKHRIRSIKKKSTGQTVWHRVERVDLISSTN